ncbi:MAG: dethiobiotin synthase [Chthoniobacterales bacterium]|nr:dethiobiotin synthase [Chthoniobacterales bacterium]
MSLFITGTDTGVGKTFTAATLLRLARATGLRCAGMKPICCGDRADAELLLAASSDGLTIDEVNPVWLKTPAAPFAASLIEGVEADVPQLLTRFADLQKRYDFVVVEGVGGWLVPIRQKYFVSDLAAEMKLPVLIVAQNRLGCLNHTLLTIRGVTSRGLPCVGVALNEFQASADYASTTNMEVLRKLTEVPILPGLAAEMSEFPPEWEQLLRL